MSFTCRKNSVLSGVKNIFKKVWIFGKVYRCVFLCEKMVKITRKIPTYRRKHTGIADYSYILILTNCGESNYFWGIYSYNNSSTGLF